MTIKLDNCNPYSPPIVIDNFLNQDQFDYLASWVVNDPEMTYEQGKEKIQTGKDHKILWSMGQIVYADHFNSEEIDIENNYQLVHRFNDETMHVLYDSGLIEQINPAYLLRVKANVTFRSSKNIVQGMHIDVGDTKQPHVDRYAHIPLRTGVFYLNTCNGGTQLEDGTFIESVANRYVEFDRRTQHSGTTPTDKPHRFVLNLNYVPFPRFPGKDWNYFRYDIPQEHDLATV